MSKIAILFTVNFLSILGFILFLRHQVSIRPINHELGAQGAQINKIGFDISNVTYQLYHRAHISKCVLQFFLAVAVFKILKLFKVDLIKTFPLPRVRRRQTISKN